MCIRDSNGRELSVDLGEICHYMTDFFTYPHNDDIYEHNLLEMCIRDRFLCKRVRQVDLVERIRRRRTDTLTGNLDDARLDADNRGIRRNLLQYGKAEKELSGSEPSTTNNRMELLGVITCLLYTS